jgi:hypothetical protein
LINTIHFLIGRRHIFADIIYAIDAFKHFAHPEAMYPVNPNFRIIVHLPMQSVPITTNVVSSNPTQARCTLYNIM